MRWTSPFLLILCLITWKIRGCDAEERKEEGVLFIPAMGRVAHLGEFYDATQEKFLNQLIFSRVLPAGKNLITIVDNPSTETKFNVIDNMKQKMTYLGIDASIAVSLKCGGFTIAIEGAASYIKDEKHSEKHVEGFLVHKTETSRESVDLYYKGIRQYVDDEALMTTDATHVVTGIYNGADVAARFVDKNQLDKDIQDIKGRLSIAFSMQQIQVSGSAQLNLTNGEFTNSSSYELSVSGDVPMETIPRNAYEVLQFIQTIPKLLEKVNGGRGKPIRYVLTPLKELREAYKMEYENTKTAATIDDAIFQAILTIFDDIAITRQKLNDLQDLFNGYINTCMTPSIKRALDDLSNHFDARSGQFTGDIRNGLVRVRSDSNVSFSLLQSIMNEYALDGFSPVNVTIQLDGNSTYEDGRRKIQFYEAFKKHDVQYLTESEYEADLVKKNDLVFYVLFYNLGMVHANITAWEDGTHLFFSRLNQPQWSQLKVVDCDFPLQNLQCQALNQTQIHAYIGNKKVSTNVLDDYLQYSREGPLRLRGAQAEVHSKFYDLGHMYSTHSNSFLHSSLFSRKNPPKSHKISPEKQTRCDILPFQYKSLFEALSIPGKTQVLVLLEDAETMSGTKKIFQLKWNPKVQRLALVCTTFSEKEYVNVEENIMMTGRSLDLLSLVDQMNATHIVQGRERVVDSILVLETIKVDGEDTGRLRKKLAMIKSILELGVAGTIFKDNDFQDITAYLYSDVTPNRIPGLNTFDDIIDAFWHRIVEEFVKDESKGQALYTFHPIPNIQLQFSLITRSRSMAPYQPPVDYQEFSKYYDQFPILNFTLRQKKAKLDLYEECTPGPDRDKILNSTIYETVFLDLHQKLQEAISAEGASTTDLRAVLKEFRVNSMVGEESLKALDAIAQKLNETMEFYDSWKDTGTSQYIRSQTELEKALAHRGKPAYFLLYHWQWMESLSERWVENAGAFLDLVMGGNSAYSFLVDCSFLSAVNGTICGGQPVILEYVEGHLNCSDVVDRIKKTRKDEQTAEDRLLEDLEGHIKEAASMVSSLNRDINATLDKILTLEKDTDAKLEELLQKLFDARDLPPPINYVYVQYKGFHRPNIIWPTTTYWFNQTNSELDVPRDASILRRFT